MEIIYCKKWWFPRKKSIEIFNEETARNNHLSGEDYTVVLKQNDMVSYVVEMAKNLEEKNMLAFLVTLIKVIAPWVAAAVVIHYLNVYNEKKHPEFYNLDDKKTPQSLFENLEIVQVKGLMPQKAA